MLTLLLGGVRAGKSARALSLASHAASGRPVLFVATAQKFDDEMTRRIAAHQRERPPHWITLESPLDVARDVEHSISAHPDVGAIVIDCLTLWVSNFLLSLPDDADVEDEATVRAAALLRSLDSAATTCRVFVVSNEVGLGVVPATPLGRRYRDALGRVNQLVAAAADDVRLLVAGIELPLKPRR